MVVTLREPIVPTGVWQDRTASPSRCTVHAPHMPMPQPYFVPVKPSVLRNIQRRGMSGGTDTSCTLLLTVSRKEFMASANRIRLFAAFLKINWDRS
jgi:hypothetical protein